MYKKICLIFCFVSLIVTACSDATLVPPTIQATTPPTAPPANVSEVPTSTPAPLPTSTPTPLPSSADADVTAVRVVKSNNTYTFHTTVSHPDTGWEDYADGWDVVLPDGTVVKKNSDDPFTRLLVHPHETEQPFTRSQSGLTIPDGITQVTVRAHDIVDGFGGQEVLVDLTVAEGENFTVEGLGE